MNSFLKSFFRFQVSLTLKFFMVMICLIFITSATFGWFFIGREASQLKGQLETHGRAIISRYLSHQSLSLLLEHGAGLTQRPILQGMAERMVTEEEVVFSTFMDNQGEWVAHAVRKGFSKDARNAYLITHPIQSREGQILGTLHLGLSFNQVEQQIVDLKTDILIVTLGIAGIGFLLTLIFTRILLKPIQTLAEATEKVTEGNLSQVVEIRSRDEIGDLARAFNQMTLQLKDSRDGLEKKVEERTRQLEENIAELNKARTVTLKMLENLQSAKLELERVNLELKEADETRMKFIGMASHELKTPLTAIKANVDFVLSEKAGKVPEDLKAQLLTIQRNTNRIQATMDHMLDLTRIKSGQLPIDQEPIFLSEVVGGYIHEIKPVDKHLTIQVDIPEDLCVYADRNRLHDIFINLLSNAFKFTPGGGTVSIVAHPKDDQIFHEIRDTGMGIPKDKLKKIFEDFYQVEGGKYGGTGLGLFIAKRVIEQHGGRIWVESWPGKGSTFYFTLPAFKEKENGRSVHSEK
ncbi:MAG: cell wall metabolism sensor histidine kinase WalK [Deltaproteobacteria bacterium]|nr:cell wall metabolism sensor histidine kinase WalK [Deltaproteobacteria bacterium]MBM4323448.1 cell wall metabolism sensor histidine kinase WalK [Deltaproteobacteria bacterium]